MDVTYGPELRFVPSDKASLRRWLPTRGPVARLIGSLAPRVPQWVVRAMIKRMLVSWQHPESALFDDGAILVNGEGKRFVNEKQTPEREIAVATQPEKQAYLLLDGQLVARYSSWPNFISTASDIAYAYINDYQRQRKDITTTGYTLEDVALRGGLDAAQLEETVRQFNEYIEGKSSDRFDRRDDHTATPHRPVGFDGSSESLFHNDGRWCRRE